jgi:Family of unknown function (DUF5302)
MSEESQPVQDAAEKAGEDEDMRAKFREALAHKQAHHAPDAAAGGGGRGLSVHGNDKRQRQFRRKSG